MNGEASVTWRLRSAAVAQTITATPRQLESLIRISEALARMRLSPTVERQDAAEALRLMQVTALPFLSFTLLSYAVRIYLPVDSTLRTCSALALAGDLPSWIMPTCGGSSQYAHASTHGNESGRWRQRHMLRW